MLAWGSRNHNSTTKCLVTPIDRHQELILQHTACSTLLLAFAQIKTVLPCKLILVHNLKFLALAKPKPSIDYSDPVSGDSLGDSGDPCHFVRFQLRDHRYLMLVSQHAHDLIGDILLDNHDLRRYLLNLLAQYLY